MKISKLFTLMFPFFLLCGTCHATGEKDKRLTAISTSQLQAMILHTPLNAPLQMEVLSRARHSHLMDVAYEEYTALWMQKPNDAFTNLLRGSSAEYLESDGMEPALKDTYRRYAQENLFSVARDCLRKATQLAPNSAVANMEEGFFLWQFDEKLPEGIGYLQKALQLAPKNPRIHATLGDVYANPYGKSYNLQKAIAQLNTAATLDPTYAFPHDLLANIYSRLGQSAKAKIERDKYQSLLP